MAFTAHDRTANGQKPAHQQQVPGLQSGDLTLRQVCAWAKSQAHRLAEGHGLTEEDRDLFLLAQAVKLGEEAGELHAEVLGRTKFQRAAKAGRYDDASLAGELADVTICVAILSEMLGANLSEAVMTKIAQLEARATR